MTRDTEDVVARVARAIDPETWALRDTDLTRRDEWERDIKIGWGEKTFEEWCDRFIGKSLEQAHAALEASDRQSLSDRIDEQRRLLATARALIRVKYGNLDADVNEFVRCISTALHQEGIAK